MCHGTQARGDGWLAEFLIQRPPALTQLKKNNGGNFPRELVARAIDGRTAIRLHGPSEMPVWGTIYKSEIEVAAGGKRAFTATGTYSDGSVNVGGWGISDNGKFTAYKGWHWAYGSSSRTSSRAISRRSSNAARTSVAGVEVRPRGACQGPGELL